jgi:D-alanyl-D-alanine dipeptidase
MRPQDTIGPDMYALSNLRTALLVAALALAPPACAASGMRAVVGTSAATDAASAGMVDVATLAPDLRIDMRYAGHDNFVGTAIDGYMAPRCYLHRDVAQALARVQATLRARGESLLIHDCYRPVRAVRHFVRWAKDPADQRNKARYYPGIDKARLFAEGYIAEQSGHSRGATVDLALLRCDAEGRCAPVDMGTGYDLFDPRSHTASPLVEPVQRANRQRLLEAMAAEGFVNYAKEWWHYTWQPEPTPNLAYDFPVR